jgi:hypothetical protein
MVSSEDIKYNRYWVPNLIASTSPTYFEKKTQEKNN